MSQDLEKNGLDRMPNAFNGLEDRCFGGRAPDCSRETIVLSPPERAQLVSCLERGAEARRSDIDHGANPYLFAPVIPQGPATREDLLNVLRVDAWWDGWEEVQRGPEQVELRR